MKSAAKHTQSQGTVNLVGVRSANLSLFDVTFSVSQSSLDPTAPPASDPSQAKSTTLTFPCQDPDSIAGLPASVAAQGWNIVSQSTQWDDYCTQVGVAPVTSSP